MSPPHNELDRIIEQVRACQRADDPLRWRAWVADCQRHQRQRVDPWLGEHRDEFVVRLLAHYRDRPALPSPRIGGSL